MRELGIQHLYAYAILATRKSLMKMDISPVKVCVLPEFNLGYLLHLTYQYTHWMDSFFVYSFPHLVCPPGEYHHPINPVHTCLQCPHSTKSEAGVGVCECLDGYFRAGGEGPEVDCTSEKQHYVKLLVYIRIKINV